MFRPEKILGPNSHVAPGSDTERDALAAVRAERIREANGRREGMVPTTYGLGESALHGTLDVSPEDLNRVITRADETRPPDGAIELPPVHEVET